MYVNTDSPVSISLISTSLFGRVPPAASLVISVIVPVRNEAGSLVKTLNALRNQRDVYGVSLQHDKYEILLLANNCTDISYTIAREYQQAHPEFALRVAEIQLPPEKAHIGTARRLLMDEAYHRFMQLGNSKGIIASTDGDTEVDATWVYHIIDEIQKGNDAVGGKILVSCRNNQPGVYQLLDETYKSLIAKTESILDPLEHDPWPRHFQYFGASLAVTCEMYHRVGGLPQLPYLEDEALHKALLRKDAKIRKSPAVKVMTSGRHEGRVDVGLSEQLKKWALMENRLEPQMVACAKDIISRFTHRRSVRTCWNEFNLYGTYHASVLASVARDLAIAPGWLQAELEKGLYFGQLWESIEHAMQATGWNKKWKPVIITTAIRDLREFIQLHH